MMVLYQMAGLLHDQIAVEPLVNTKFGEDRHQGVPDGGAMINDQQILHEVHGKDKVFRYKVQDILDQISRAR